MSGDPSPAADYRDVAGHFGSLVEGVPDEATWNRAAPPAGWTARDVVWHLLEWFPPFLHQGTGIALPPGPSVDADPVGAWRTFSAALQALLDDPTAQDQPFSHPRAGSMPLPQAVAQFFTADVFLHSWDLARATGQDEALDPERCAAMLAGMEPWDEILRASGQYGPRVEVPDDADPQTRLLAFIGRDPR